MQGWQFQGLLLGILSSRRLFSFGLFKKISIFCFALVASLFSPLILETVFAQTTTTKVYLAGNQSSSGVGIVGGKTLSVLVKVDNISNSSGLAAFTFKIGYNTNLVSIPDTNNDYIADPGTVTVGPFLGSSGRQVRCGYGYISIDSNDYTKRYLTFTCVTLGSTPTAPKGSGILATVNFKTGNTVSDVPLSLVTAQLADNTASANLISNTTSDVTATVAKCADVVGNDHQVLIEDILYIVDKYFTNDPAADLNGDGKVLVDDIVIAVAEYYQTC